MDHLFSTLFLATFGNVLFVVGLFLWVGGWLWAITSAFKSGAAWGIANIIPLQPLIAIISAFAKKIEWSPAVVMFIGGVLCSLGRSWG